jgi:hypothetical protein
LIHNGDGDYVGNRFEFEPAEPREYPLTLLPTPLHATPDPLRMAYVPIVSESNLTRMIESSVLGYEEVKFAAYILVPG